MKTRTMNELRQEKNYGYKPPLTHNQKSAEARASAPKPSEMIPRVNQYDNRLCTHTEIDVNTTKELIIKDLSNEMYDTIFQAVNDEMAKHEVFQEQTYFTLQGIEEFNETWFEFYHEHHGDIMGAIFKSFTN